MKLVNTVLIVLFTLMLTVVAFAQTAPPADVPADQFLGQIFDLVKQFGGLPWAGKISGIILLLIASMKVSFLRPLWDKLGNAKSWAAPLLGMALGIVSLSMSGQLTLAGAFAYFFAGAGAILISELLELVKAIPGIGAGWLVAINWLKGMLGAPKTV